MNPVKRKLPQWVLAYAKDDYLVDYLRHPDFIFNDMGLAIEGKPDGFLLLKHIIPSLRLEQVYVVPLREFSK